MVQFSKSLQEGKKSSGAINAGNSPDLNAAASP